MNNVEQWYNGYRFYHKAPHRLYNPDMVLYFTKEFGGRGEYPDELLDINIASDYGKIHRIFRIGNQEEQNLAVLNELITEGELTACMTRQFSFERKFTQDDLVSLLFYMGIITIKQSQLDGLLFVAPNYVIKRLYFEFFS